MNAGKCPGCKQVVHTADVERIEIKDGPFGTTWVGVSYVCSNWNCRTVLSVAIDPVALKTDIVKEVRKLLGRA